MKTVITFLLGVAFILAAVFIRNLPLSVAYSAVVIGAACIIAGILRFLHDERKHQRRQERLRESMRRLADHKDRNNYFPS